MKLLKISSALFKTLFILYYTCYCYILTLIKPHDLQNIKKNWALVLLNTLGYQLSMTGHFSKSNPLVCVGNHISYLDILVLLATNPNLVFLAKSEIKSWPIIGAAATQAGTMYVNRKTLKDRAEIKSTLIQILTQHQKQLVLFPSGTTTIDENISWKLGIFKISNEYQIPVQNFKIEYEPTRASAYIDDDTLVPHIFNLFMVPDKKVKIHIFQETQIKDLINDVAQLKAQSTCRLNELLVNNSPQVYN